MLQLTGLHYSMRTLLTLSLFRRDVRYMSHSRRESEALDAGEDVVDSEVVDPNSPSVRT